MNDREIEEMECTCPYAEDGNYCKHMAAVLYAAEKEPACNEDRQLQAGGL